MKKSVPLDYAYNDYITTVSSSVMAVSLECSKFMIEFCNKTQQKHILDMGSGFSSYALRQVKNADVVTVDTDSEWLRRTTKFLDNYGCCNGKLLTTENFGPGHDYYHDFDFVFFDLARFQTGTRQQWLPYIIEYVISPKTVLLLDDMDATHYFLYAITGLSKFKYTMQNTRNETLDKYGRFSMMFSGITPYNLKHSDGVFGTSQ